MSAAKALDILGLHAGASVQEIRAAYKRIIRAVHPDAGGSNYLAMSVNAARDTLLDGA
jgi:curved DNA-binding protein CbpA